jgi:integrase
MQWTVFDRYGQRKYLTKDETETFLQAAQRENIPVQLFCWMIALTGCRISEALSLSKKSIDFDSKHVIIECLKKREGGVYRAVPLPVMLLDKIEQALESGALKADRLWPWSRMTGYRRILEVMKSAGLEGIYATPKGLRHGFGVSAIQSHVPLNLVQRWLGHADIKTTAIYTNAMGPEERDIASRMWNDVRNLTLKKGGRTPSKGKFRRSQKPAGGIGLIG